MVSICVFEFTNTLLIYFQHPKTEGRTGDDDSEVIVGSYPFMLFSVLAGETKSLIIVYIPEKIQTQQLLKIKNDFGNLTQRIMVKIDIDS